MRELTRFLRNEAIKDVFNSELNVDPRDTTGRPGEGLVDPKRNGTGLGGAIYINDRQPPGVIPGYALWPDGGFVDVAVGLGESARDE